MTAIFALTFSLDRARRHLGACRRALPAGAARPRWPTRAAARRPAPPWSCRSTTRIPPRTTAALEAMAQGLQRGRRSRRLRDRRPLRFHATPIPGSARRSPSTASRTTLRGIMPVWYRRRWANTGEEGRQHQGLRRAMGRPLRPFHRARRRQPDGAEDAGHARRRDGARTRSSASCRPCPSSPEARRCSRGCSSSPAACTARSWRAGSPPGRAATAITGATTPSSAPAPSPNRCGPAGASGPASRSAGRSCRTISSRPR